MKLNELSGKAKITAKANSMAVDEEVFLDI